MDIDIDPATGMRAVPKDYRWKVTFCDGGNYDLWPSVTVTLQRKKRIWHNDASMSWALGVWAEKLNAYESKLKVQKLKSWRGTEYLLIDPIEYPKLIDRLSGHVLDKVANAIARSEFDESYRLAEEKFKGNYPPKKLS